MVAPIFPTNLSYLGFKVVINPWLDNRPRMQLSPMVMVTDEFRAEMNKWMLEFFGTKDEVIIMQDQQVIMMGPKTKKKFQQMFNGDNNGQM